MNVTSLSTYTDTILSVGTRVFTIDYNYTDLVLCIQDQVPQHDRHSVHGRCGSVQNVGSPQGTRKPEQVSHVVSDA